MTTPTYVIRGGLEGRERLRVLARVMWPTTSELFARVGIDAAARCLDVGCGGGDVTLALARYASMGSVIGTDLDETKLELACADAASAALPNVKFRVENVMDAPAPDEEFDVVYARILLTHLPDPAKALSNLRARLAPDGVLLVEDIDFSGHICHPRCAALEKYVQLYQAAAARRGCDANIGPKLYLMMLDAGWRELNLDVAQPTFFAGEGKQIAILTLVNIADAILVEQLASQAELDQAIEDLARYTEAPRTLISLPRIFQLWGRRG